MTDSTTTRPNIEGYMDDVAPMLDDLTDLQLDSLEAALESIEQACITIHRLLLHETTMFHTVGSIFENARDLAFDPLFTEQDD